MLAVVVVKLDPGFYAKPGLGDRAVSLQENFLVFQAPPKPLDEDVVQKAAFAIHADLDVACFEQRSERFGGELRALIGVEDFRLSVSIHRLLQRFHAEIALQRNRQTPRQHPPAEPVHHRNQINKAPGHRNIRYIGAPDLIGMVDVQIPQQIWVDFVSGMSPAGVRLLGPK